MAVGAIVTLDKLIAKGAQWCKKDGMLDVYSPHALGSRDKVGHRNKIREAARCEPLTDQGVCSAFANRSLLLYA